MSSRQFQSIQGPVDPSLRHSAIEGYQPVSRIGEIVINSFTDSYEFAALPSHITHSDLMGLPDMAKLITDKQAEVAAAAGTPNEAKLNKELRALQQDQANYKADDEIEQKPHFHEWATVLPGMICVSRKARNSTFRNYVAAETATPVIACCGCLKMQEESNFYFAGVARSKSVRPMDDGVGPSVDEFCKLLHHTYATNTIIERCCVCTRSHDRDWWHGHPPEQQRHLGVSRRHARVDLLQRGRPAQDERGPPREGRPPAHLHPHGHLHLRARDRPVLVLCEAGRDLRPAPEVVLDARVAPGASVCTRAIKF